MWGNNQFVLKVRGTTHAALGILLFSPLKKTILEMRQWVAEFLIFSNLKADWTLRLLKLYGHNRIGHNYVGHNYAGDAYIGVCAQALRRASGEGDAGGVVAHATLLAEQRSDQVGPCLPTRPLPFGPSARLASSARSTQSRALCGPTNHAASAQEVSATVRYAGAGAATCLWHNAN